MDELKAEHLGLRYRRWKVKDKGVLRHYMLSVCRSSAGPVPDAPPVEVVAQCCQSVLSAWHRAAGAGRWL